jgi:SAM-dependent MidA family methyltransferase
MTLLSSMNEESQNINGILERAASNGPISYRDYIEIALYHPACGYYSAKTERVGRKANTDFYTAESLGAVFSELVVSGVEALMGKESAEATFVEIAAEPERALLQYLPNHPFKDSRTIRLGEAISAEGPVVLFANEWLDALPFHRLTFIDAKWQERGVAIKDNTLEEVLLPDLSPAVAAQAQRLPDNATEGYCFDWPLDAEKAFSRLIKQDWQGLLVFFDYGKPWQELLQNCPAGTARTYYKHQVGSDLLANPGKADITCDICWSALQDACVAAGLDEVSLESQEAFFVQRAQAAASAIVRESAGQFSPRRQTLMELIHPAHMGRKFQVLTAIRKS